LAGVRPGDIITHIENHATGLPRDVSLALLRRRPGERVRVRIVRAGQADVIRAILREERQPVRHADKPSSGKPVDADLGLSLVGDETGSVSLEVAGQSEAESAGLQSGDRLDAINGVEFATLDQARAALRSALAMGPVVVRVERAGQGRRHVMLGRVIPGDGASGTTQTDGSRLPHGPV
jgi:S1-C subfamily serine protease